MTKPFVYIVGAGPGDPELLTVKAHRLLTQTAEVVVHDRLISDALLALIPPHVTRIYAGKSREQHCMKQDEINQCLVEEASKGKIIVRLKGGDPFIFGRGGEEAEYLAQHNIPYEIIPGISASAGCSASAGIPLTYRGLATSVRYLTGHLQKGEAELPLDWQGLADPHTTLVIYMGLANIQFIADRLREHGLAADTPAAAIQDGTTPQQRVAVTTLQALPEAVRDFKAPTLVIVGKVVGISPAASARSEMTQQWIDDDVTF